MSKSLNLQKEKVSRVTVGTDPEFFLRDNNTGGLVSAIGIVKGTKEEPIETSSGAMLQYDNVAIEFATIPSEDTESFVESIRRALLDVHDSLPENLEIVAEPSAEFELDQLMCEEAMRFGCDPDFDAWSLTQNTPPNPENMFLRSCGGHLHIGHVPGDGCEFISDPFGKVNMIKAMDTFHGILSVVLDNSQSANDRRNLYGKAGCYRPTDYGVEYRVLSNFWLKSPDRVRLMDSLSQDVIRYLKGYSYDFLTDLESNLNIVEQIDKLFGDNSVVNIINNGDVDKAKEIVDNYISKYMSEETIELLHTVMQEDENKTLKESWGIN